MNLSGQLGVGALVLVAFPSTNLSGSKVRPALVIAESPPDDVILAFITTRLAPARETDVVLLRSDPEFEAAGLRFDSRVRVDRLATLERALVIRRLGEAGPQTLANVRRGLRQVLAL